jgi:hypothetical protein
VNRRQVELFLVFTPAVRFLHVWRQPSETGGYGRQDLQNPKDLLSRFLAGVEFGLLISLDGEF